VLDAKQCRGIFVLLQKSEFSQGAAGSVEKAAGSVEKVDFRAPGGSETVQS